MRRAVVGAHGLRARAILLLLSASLLGTAAAQNAPAERSVLVREGYVYLNPDASSAKVATVGRGREVAITARSHEWVQVFAMMPERQVAGWMLDKGIVRPSDPQGDRIIFGEAADSEAEASRSHGRKDAAQDAMRLYYRLQEYFPNSPMAAEAMYRAADIRWQLDKADASTRGSAKAQRPEDRYQLDEEWMKQVIKKYPRTPQADLAAYELLDNKLCGEWLAEPKCPERESELYEKYVAEHPQSPKAAEALYNAAWRQAALIDIYRTSEQANKIGGARAKAAALCQRVISQYPQSDWAMRATRLNYMVQQGISVYGGGVE
jgi:outer membrane protein assembly factor BamD (BamD/ComL family)